MKQESGFLNQEETQKIYQILKENKIKFVHLAKYIGKTPELISGWKKRKAAPEYMRMFLDLADILNAIGGDLAKKVKSNYESSLENKTKIKATKKLKKFK